MPRFAVLLHAQKLRLLNQYGQAVLGGAYTWRVVEATMPSEAEDLARGKLFRDEVFLREIWNAPDEPAEVQVEEVSAVESVSAKDSACVYYFEDENDTPYGAHSNDAEGEG